MLIVGLSRREVRRTITGLAIVCGIALLVAGWRYIRNWRLYSGFTGLGPMLEITGGWPESLGWRALLSLARWTMMTPGAWGRLLFPAAWAINLLLALGWSHWVMPPRRNAWLAVPVGALAVLALLTPFLVIRPAFQKPALIHPDAVPVAARRAPVYHGALARSLGGMIEPAVAHPGDTVWVTIYWAVMERPDRDYTVFVHLVDTNGDKVAQSDGQPVNGAWPTSAWEPGSPVVDRHRLAIPSDTAPGTYFLQAGMYLLASGERLPVAGLNDRVQDNAMTLGTAEVTHE